MICLQNLTHQTLEPESLILFPTARFFT